MSATFDTGVLTIPGKITSEVNVRRSTVSN